ncbi:MAG: rRNA methylase, putative, group 3 [Mycobacterium sp.]|jgi:23S rRNA (guanosine2251-2'-O)-methyltransferase|nr:rRNA methylase, putative, group 3 [Mycobacterium sp.]MCW2745734.1 rRNA methylase, putative, group 3 [Mycobacterium sp.]
MSAGRGGTGGRANKPGSARKGSVAGTGGKRRKGLQGRGPTPKAEERTGHPAARRAASVARRAVAGAPRRPEQDDQRGGEGFRASRGGRREDDSPEVVFGRNSVVEALRGKVPASALHIASGIDRDARVAEAITLAGTLRVPVLEGSRAELDRLTDGAVHQGLALQIPPYTYLHPDDLLQRVLESTSEPLVVALDGVTDPRNLGAVVRSAAAFGAGGVLLPERRAAGMTASAWKTSAGAAARVPVARATNLVRALKSYADAGLTIVGLAGEGDVTLDELDVANDALVLVVGSEDKGLSRLVAETCDVLVRIPMTNDVESLNAGVAAGVALAEIARRRRGA